jgi:hypothetical protein
MSRKGKIFIEADEMWTFVGDKGNDIGVTQLPKVW